MPFAKPALLVLALGSFAVFTQACTLASPTHITEEPAADSKGDDDDSTSSSTASSASTTSTAATGGTCANPEFTKPDVSTLTACGAGKGHCYGAAKVPAASIFGADTCSSGQVCVPDEVLSADGQKLKSCTVSILSKPGGCINLDLVPQMKAQGAGALKQDGCDAGQVCAPCQDPTNNDANTPFCQPIGVTATDCSSSAGTTGAATTTASPVGCCTTNGVSNGQCLPSSAIPSNASSMTSQDSCAAGNVCAPKSLVTGQPKTCDGGLMAFGGSSICLDKCFSSQMSLGSDFGLLSQDACGATELCIPCNLIKLGAGDTPVPGCGN